MNRRLFYVLPLLLIVLKSSAQKPYFQQDVNTQIEVSLDDKNHYLHGREQFSYRNNSSDTLTYLYIHLWPNAYSHDRTAFSRQQAENGKTAFYYSRPAQRGFIDSLSFKVDGEAAGFTSDFITPDIARLNLPAPCLPGQTITVATPFRVKIPKVFSRLGHTGQSYCITQWFPKPAVYDNRGWHPIPYLDQGEFYSEIGSYDVSITLPKNYVVMATGNCTDEAENQWLTARSKAKLEKPKTALVQPPSDVETKTLHFHEDQIHDFAWFADKRYILRMDSVVTDSNAQPLMVYAAFLPGGYVTWLKATDYLKSTIREYGARVGPYPYKTIKAVEGDMKAGGGMEYPTVTVIDRGMFGNGLRDVVVHEAGHNWFYGILASNERQHGWMDEGMNTFFERKTVQVIKGDSAAKGFGRGDDVVLYQAQATGTDQSLAIAAPEYTYLNYAGDVYVKTALLLQWLEGYLGKASFDAAIHDYFDTWKHRHPYPEDFRAVMERHAGGKDLTWFFDGAMKDDRRIDAGIKSVRKQHGRTDFVVRNKSSFPAPVGLRLLKKDSSLINLMAATGAGERYDANDSTVWTAPFTGTKTISLAGNFDYKNALLLPFLADGRERDNLWQSSLLRRRGGRKIVIGASTTTSNNEIFVLPSLGYNYYDGFMAGLLIHNLTLPESRFRYVLSPMYAFGAKTFVGAGSVSYSLQEIAAGVDGKSFDYGKTDVNTPKTLYARYIKVAPYLQFFLKERSLRSPVQRSLLLKGYYVQEDGFDFNLDLSDSLYKPSITGYQTGYGLIRYTHQNDRAFNPFSYAAELHGNKDFLKLSVTGKLRIDYYAPKKSLYIRAFAGRFFDFSSGAVPPSRYYLNSTFTTANDYLYDHTFLGRTGREGFSAHQVAVAEGGLKLPTPLLSAPLGRTGNWLASLNLKSDLPLGKLPLRVFADVATFAHAAELNPSGNKILYAAGLELHALNDLILVNVPLILSSDYRDYYKGIMGGSGPGKTYTFSLQLQQMDWTKLQRMLLKLMAK